MKCRHRVSIHFWRFFKIALFHIFLNSNHIIQIVLQTETRLVINQKEYTNKIKHYFLIDQLPMYEKDLGISLLSSTSRVRITNEIDSDIRNTWIINK